MLAKVAPPTNDFHGLARYLVRGKSGTKSDPRRVAWVRTQNLPTDDPELAAKYMAATAHLSARTRNAAYHLMIAWHARERPTEDLMQEVAADTLEMAGLAEHQALIMGHGDKPHPHLHILLNRVHPETGRAWKASHDFARFDRIMRELASSYGCEYTPAHAYNPEQTEQLPKKPDSPATYAGRRGAETMRLQWSRATARRFGEQISEDLDRASSTEDVEFLMAEHGFAVEAKGKGFVIGNSQSYAKFSSLGLTTWAQARGFDFNTLRSKPFRKPVLSADAVDIVRAFVTLGLATQDDVRSAVEDARVERLARADAVAPRKSASGILAAASTALSPPNRRAGRSNRLKRDAGPATARMRPR